MGAAEALSSGCSPLPRLCLLPTVTDSAEKVELTAMRREARGTQRLLPRVMRHCTLDACHNVVCGSGSTLPCSLSNLGGMERSVWNSSTPRAPRPGALSGRHRAGRRDTRHSGPQSPTTKLRAVGSVSPATLKPWHFILQSSLFFLKCIYGPQDQEQETVAACPLTPLWPTEI